MGLAQQCARPMVVHNKIIKKELEAVEGTQYVTKESILRRAREIKGIPLRNVDKTGRLATGKGAIGTVIEESWFGYTPNSESEPDFPEAGVELKVTPYLRGKNGIRAKERLVCNIINYMEEYDKTFQTSAFWHKCNTMLLMSYEHLADKPKGDFRIDEAVLFSFPDEDLAIIEHDWETIMEKVRAGRAHELSEGDTLYLAACTKGANASSVRQQPFSELPAKQRAYAYGDYEAVEACIIAAEYPENIAAYYSEVVQRYYTLGSHPVRNKQWNSLKLLRYSYAAGELSYVDVTP